MAETVMAICPDCGADCGASQRICRECGAEVDGEERTYNSLDEVPPDLRAMIEAARRGQ